MGAIQQEHEEVYVYGFELIFSFLFCTATILIVSLIVHKVIEAIVFMILFVVLRQFTGGLHANTYLRCQICTVAGYLSVVFLSLTTQPSLVFHSILLLLGAFTIIAIGPIESIHKPLTPQGRVRNKKIGTVLFVISGTCGMITMSSYQEISNTIFYTLLLIIILMIIPCIGRRK